MLLGRGREQAAIEGLIGQAREGRSGAVLLTGEPGCGKTALLAYAANAVSGVTVGHSQGIEAESSLPFAALADVLRPVLHEIDGLPEFQAASLRAALALGPPVPGDRFATYAAVLALLALASDRRPYLLIVDDLQWIDPESAEALFFASRRLMVERVAMLFGARADVPLPADPASIPVLHLVGLEEEAGLDLIGREAPSIAPAVAATIYQGTGGNPLAIIEAIDQLTERQRRGDDPLPTPLPVGTRLVAAYQDRLSRLPAPTQNVLLLAAASDDQDLITIAQAARLAGFDPVSALTEGERAGLIHLSSDVAFRHPLIRSAVYAAASPEDRRQAHRALAQALPDQAAAARAWHNAAAAIGPEEETARDLEAVAIEQRARRAYAAAFHAFNRSAELTAEPPHRVRRLCDAAISALLAGRGATAVALYEQALSVVSDPVLRADLVLMRGQIMIWLREPMAGHQEMAEEAERIASLDPRRAALLLIHAAGPCFMAGEILRSRQTALRALELARQSGHAPTIAAAEVALAEAMLLHGERVGADLLRESMPKLAKADAEIGNSITIRYGAFCQIAADDLESARATLQAEIAGQRAQGAVSLLPYPLGVMSELEYRTGRWMDGYANASESVRLAEETGEDSGRTYSLVCLARFDAVMGRDQECRAHLAEARRLAERFGVGSIYSYVWALEGLRAVGREQWRNARDSLTELREYVGRHEMLEPGVLRYHADLIEAHLRLDERPAALNVLQELEHQAEATGRPWARMTVQRCRGMLTRGADFDPHFENALAQLGDTHDAFELGRTELSYGEALRRARRRGEARQHLGKAREIFRELGARPWMERAQRELAASGERLTREAAPAGTVLTPQELQVCLAVARGETNREVAAHLFLSLKTIETHLSNAYGKLGLRSRTELARLFAIEPPRVAV